MQKNASFNKFICFTTAISFSFAVMLPYTAKANNLAPLSFKKMYSLAQNGDVEALRASVRRGMNIDVVTPDGDTGLCIAAKRHDAYTYNTFRAAGANPHHPCIQNIDDYEEFVNSSKAVPVTAVPREAYGRIGAESYSISSRTWWILGGLALVGGAVAIAASSGGGGSGGSDDGSDGKKHTETYSSLGTNTASNGKTYKSTTGSASLKKTLAIENDKIKKDQIDKIDLLRDVMNTTGYMYRGLLAKKSGTYTNAVSGILELGTASAGMVAINKSDIINNGYIKADAANATVAMIASNSSTAINNSAGIIDRTSSLGIDLNFAGDSVTKTVVGMYADSNSTLINNGDIRGTATQVVEVKESNENSSDENSSNVNTTANTVLTTAIKGNIVGMEAMILNVGSDVQSDVIKLTNSSTGEINLSAGDSGSTEAVVNLTSIGMGSFLDIGFLNGSKNITRAETVSLINNGKINIGYTGSYQAAEETPLRKGTGGIVGMRAEANTTAINSVSGLITLTLADYGSQGGSATSSSTDTGAGMQSIHGSNLTNNGVIQIVTNASNEIVNYGMLAVEGSGTVSGLYTNNKQILNNNGTIYVEASNSYGMASYNGGTLNNNLNSNIIVGKDLSNTALDADTLYTNNVGMFGSGDSTIVKMNNYGTIDVFSYKSVAMKNNFSGGTEICNDNIINIHASATDSKVFDGFYSIVRNKGTINYYLSEPGTPSEKGMEGDPFSNYQLIINKSVMTSKSATSTSSTTEFVYNNNEINLNGSSFSSVLSVETERGVAENYGTIKLKENKFGSEGNSVGMYLSSNTISAAYIDNIGTIETNFYMSAAMASDSTQNAAMVNHGDIITQKTHSIGMYASNRTLMTNYKNISMLGHYNIGMYTTGASDLKNQENAKINIGTDNQFVNDSYGLYSKGNSTAIENHGIISLYSSSGAAIKSTGSTMKVTNYKNIEGSMAYGIYTTGDDTFINNTSDGVISGATDTGIFASGNNVIIVNDGIIGSTGARPNTGINSLGESSNITNSNTIYASGTGINTVASGTSSDTETVIKNTGTINAGSYGIYVTIDSYDTYLTVLNSGTINAPVGIFFQHNYEKPEQLPQGFEAHINLVSGGASYSESYIVKTSSSSAIKTTSAKHINFVNTGVLNLSSDIDFDDSSVMYSVGQNGTYQAPSLTGTVLASNTLVQDSFDTTYTNNNSFIGQDNGINVISQSHMFTASKITNNNGNIDIILTKKPFTDIVSSNSLATFLENNYKLNNNESLYNKLKTASSQNSFDNVINDKFGLNFIPNIAKQNLDNERIIQTEINNDLLEKSNNNRHISKIYTYKNKVDYKSNTIGYKDRVIAAYNINDTYLKQNIRMGVGLSAIRVDSKYSDNSNRYNNILELFVPLSIQKQNLYGLIKPKTGFGRGHYTRVTYDGKNKAQTKEYYYGVDAATKYTLNNKYFNIEPNTSFSVTGMYLKGDKESNNGIKLKSKNIISALTSVGIDINKEININKEHSLTVTGGAKYYHEFGNNYTQKATINNMDGFYKIDSNRLNRDFGLLQAKAKYMYEQFLLEVSVNKPLESKHNTYYMFDIGYQF